MLTRTLLGVDVDVGARIVGIGTGFVDLAHGDVLDRRRGKYVERDEFVVGVGRGDRLAVERRDAVTVAQAAHDELAGIGHGDSRDLPDTLLHVRDALERHLPGSHVLDRHVRGDALGLETPLRLEVAAAGHLHGRQRLRIGLKEDLQPGLTARDLHAARDIRNIGNHERMVSIGKVEPEMSQGVGRRTFGRALHQHGRSDERFTGRPVRHDPLDDRSGGREAVSRSEQCSNDFSQRHTFSFIFFFHAAKLAARDDNRMSRR